jgi:hypothetical protein
VGRAARAATVAFLLQALHDDHSRAEVLTERPPRIRLAWVVGDSAPYGVYIDTPALIAKLAAELGFKRGEDITVRSRGLRWRQNGSRHQVPLTERLITFKR